LTNVQKQPGPTRNYGSEGARQNSIRRRVMSVKTTGSKTNYGPLFGGKKKPSVFSNCGFCGDRSVEEGKNVYYNNGGTSGTNTYWNKIAVGPKGVGGMTCCCQFEQGFILSGSGTGPLGAVGNTIQQGTATGIIIEWAMEQITDQLWESVARVGSIDCQRPFVNSVGIVVINNIPRPETLISGAEPAPNKCSGKNRLCGGDNGTTLLGGAPCSLGGKNWLNYRRFHPGAAKA
jgi:hypothetical protein